MRCGAFSRELALNTLKKKIYFLNPKITKHFLSLKAIIFACQGSDISETPCIREYLMLFKYHGT